MVFDDLGRIVQAVRGDQRVAAQIPRCGAIGDTVDYMIYPGATHTTVIAAARSDVLQWLADRAAGTPAPSTCS